MHPFSKGRDSKVWHFLNSCSIIWKSHFHKECVMSRTKSHNNALLHPIDTVAHWYTDVQNIPNQWRKNLVIEKEAALRHIKKLSNSLKQARNLQSHAKTQQVNANRRFSERPTEAARAMVRKYKAKYQSVRRKVEKITNDMKIAKTHLNHAKLKQKYFHALGKAFATVTKIFTHKHGKK